MYMAEVEICENFKPWFLGGMFGLDGRNVLEYTEQAHEDTIRNFVGTLG